MDSLPSDESAGGFIPQSHAILSPPATSVASSTTNGHRLPLQRSKPLKYGSAKESFFIRSMDEGINNIQRNFAKRKVAMAHDHNAEAAIDSIISRSRGDADNERSRRGYDSFKEVARNIETLVDIAWVSATPSLQIPYFLTLALLVVDTMPGFPAAPKYMFLLLDKLDIAFASMMQGRDLQTGEMLPGFHSGKKVNDTEKVRIKSLVERTRITVINVMASGEFEEASEEEDSGDDVIDFDARNLEDKDIMDVDINGEDEWEMQMAKVYDRTIVELGDAIGATPIGIVTDD